MQAPVARVLILYGTTDGQTRKIAGVVADTLEALGCPADVVDAATDAAVRPEPYDGVIVAASVRVGGYQRAVTRWVRAHASALNRRPTAFVSVCLAVLEQRAQARHDLEQIVQRFLARAEWRADVVQQVAGAVRYTRYNWLVKWAMSRIVARAGGGTDTTRDYEYTDWDDVRRFTREFAKRYALAPIAPARIAAHSTSR